MAGAEWRLALIDAAEARKPHTALFTAAISKLTVDISIFITQNGDKDLLIKRRSALFSTLRLSGESEGK